jgi:signal peptidase I
MGDIKFLDGPGAEPENAAGSGTAPKTNKTLTCAIEAAILVLALMLGLFIRFYVYETAIVTSDSMLPTLKRNDRLLVDHRQSLRGRWQRGDVVIFEPPETWEDAGDTFVKRIIGLPGETVEIRGSEVLVNNQVLKEDYLLDTPEPQIMPPLLLPPGQYWVMGDNRNNSADSRRSGPLPEAALRGRVVYLLGPFGRTGGLPAAKY